MVREILFPCCNIQNPKIIAECLHINSRICFIEKDLHFCIPENPKFDNLELPDFMSAKKRINRTSIIAGPGYDLAPGNDCAACAQDLKFVYRSFSSYHDG